MKYQLVIQFLGNTDEDFERLIKLEEQLEEKITTDSDIDGHDFGSGEMNIFILTNEPNETFKQSLSLLIDINEDIFKMKAAFRKIDGNDFTILWPQGLSKFMVK